MKNRLMKLFFLNAILYFILSFFFVYALLHCMSNFVDVSATATIVQALIIGAIISIIASGLETVILRKGKMKEGKVRNWINKNHSFLLICYVVLVFLLISITNHPIWTADEVNDVLTIEWTIFGLSLTIFLVWNVLIVEYLRKKQPEISGRPDLIKEYELLVNRKLYIREIDTTFSTIILLSINLVLLILSSSVVYISHLPEEVFTHNLICCTFYFTAGTITQLFFDLLKPLKEDKKGLKTANHVTEAELNKAMIGAIIQDSIEREIQKINDSEELTDEEKRKRVDRCFDEWKYVISEMRKKDMIKEEKE